MAKAKIIEQWDRVFQDSKESPDIDCAAIVASIFDDHIVSLDSVSRGQKNF